ncbi:kinase-like protein [Clavulina sp. PMI_390]|nr:kinase-like protein [Clavulina sp. PMI_390]
MTVGWDLVTGRTLARMLRKRPRFWRAKSTLQASSATTQTPGDNVPSIPTDIREQIGLGPQSDVSTLSLNQQTDFLNRLYDELQTRSDPNERATALTCLQDFCYYFNSVPTPLRIYDVKFLRENLIAAGSEASTYTGEVLGKPVVVREALLITRELNQPIAKEIAKLVHRDAMINSQLHHRNILQLLGIYEEAPGSQPLTIVPYIERRSLQNILTPGDLLGADNFQDILLGINNAVIYLHSLHPPVIHGNIHPGNVLLSEDGQPLLCDFGFSIFHREGAQTWKSRAGGRTRFLAPELARDEVDPFRPTWQTDIYALAMLSFNMWTGDKPFPELVHDREVSIKAAKGQRPKRPTRTAIRANIPQEMETVFWELLNRMWAQNPAKRPPGTEVLERFTEIFEGTASPAGTKCYIMIGLSELWNADRVGKYGTHSSATALPSPKSDLGLAKPAFTSLSGQSGLNTTVDPSGIPFLPDVETSISLDRIYQNLMNLSKDSDAYPQLLRRLQDLCSMNSLLPASLILKDIAFDRENVIGKGDEVMVYKGRMADRFVAVREVFLTPKEWTSASGNAIKQLVHREAITHSLLNHPNILPFLGIYHETPTSPPLIIVQLEDESLQDLIWRNGLIDSKTFQHVIIGASRAVAYLHSRQPPIIHGDLHPGNILVNEAGTCYLCDFGLSRIRHEVTRTRTTIQEGGSMRFLAPELSASASKKFRTTSGSDIYSLAMTSLATWSGKSPFPEVWNNWEVISRVIRGERPKFPSDSSIALPLHVEAALWGLLQDMWAHRPAKRPSAPIIVERLENIFELNP